MVEKKKSTHPSKSTESLFMNTISFFVFTDKLLHVSLPGKCYLTTEKGTEALFLLLIKKKKKTIL